MRWYLRYSLSYRDLEEMMQERGLSVDHTTIYRWTQRYAPELDKRCRAHLKPTNNSYRVQALQAIPSGIRSRLVPAFGRDLAVALGFLGNPLSSLNLIFRGNYTIKKKAMAVDSHKILCALESYESLRVRDHVLGWRVKGIPGVIIHYAS